MRKRNRNPFGQILPKIVPVCKGERTVYFGAFGGLSPVLNPVNIQETEKRQAQVTVLLFTAAKRLAEKLGITEDDARQQYFPRNIEGVEVAPRNFLDDLLPAEQEQVILLRQETADLDVKVATLLMQYRVAYDLVVESSAAVGATELQVQEPWFETQVGDRIRFDSTTVTITQPYTNGVIGIQSLSTQLEVGATGFLLAKDGIGYVLGDSSWTEEDTRTLLTTRVNPSDPPGQIQEIFAFYQREAGRGEEVEEEEVGFTSSGGDSKTISTPNQLIGENSTGNSSTSTALMNGSTTPTLATVPPG